MRVIPIKEGSIEFHNTKESENTTIMTIIEISPSLKLNQLMTALSKKLACIFFS